MPMAALQQNQLPGGAEPLEPGGYFLPPSSRHRSVDEGRASGNRKCDVICCLEGLHSKPGKAAESWGQGEVAWWDPGQKVWGQGKCCPQAWAPLLGLVSQSSLCPGCELLCESKT